jgi:hypothetical protein
MGIGSLSGRSPMVKVIADVRYFVAALVLALVPAFALAQSSSRSGASGGGAGDADFGLLIIVGLVGLFVVVAWLISRMGDDGGRGPDHTML